MASLIIGGEITRLLTNKKSNAFTSGIFMIEINLSLVSSKVMDTRCGYDICTYVQDLIQSRSFARGEVNLHVGIEARLAALVVGLGYLSLPISLVLELKNYNYVLAISKNFIFVSTLDRLRFLFIINKGSLSFGLNDVFYGIASLINGLYI